MMKFSGIVLLLAVVATVHGSSLRREKRQSFTTNPLMLTTCDPRNLMCPPELLMPLGPDGKPVTTIPTDDQCQPAVAPSTTQMCKDTAKMCCPITSPAPAAGAAKQTMCVTPIGMRPGKCPSRDQVGPVWNECVYDTNCSGKKKCCGGGLTCSYYACTTV